MQGVDTSFTTALPRAGRCASLTLVQQTGCNMILSQWPVSYKSSPSDDRIVGCGEGWGRQQPRLGCDLLVTGPGSEQVSTSLWEVLVTILLSQGYT